MGDVRTKKKKPKQRLSEINAMVEGFCKQNTMSFFQQAGEKSSPSCKKNKVSVFEKCREQKSNPNVKQGLRQHLSKKMAAGRPADDQQFGTSEFFHKENQFEAQEKKSLTMNGKMNDQATKDYPKSYPNENKSIETDENSNVGAQNMEDVIELTTEQCNILLDLFENQGSVNEILINSEGMIQQGSSAPVRECSAEQDCLSPVTSTSNMLEKLLRSLSICWTENFTSEDSEDSSDEEYEPSYIMTIREDTQTEAMIEESEDEEGFDEESLDFDVQPGPGVSKILSQEDAEDAKEDQPFIVGQEKSKKDLLSWTKDVVNHYWFTASISNTKEEFIKHSRTGTFSGIDLLPWTITTISTETFLLKKMAQHTAATLSAAASCLIRLRAPTPLTPRTPLPLTPPGRLPLRRPLPRPLILLKSEEEEDSGEEDLWDDALKF
uniref:Uncharacterized protein n=1 Tax=Magallana gigas TaxID=29159 RepID=K1RCR5_MAGGI